MKIAIIFSNDKKQGFMPLGILCIAAYVEKYSNDTQIDIYDVFPNQEELISKEYDIIGFSCMSVQYGGVYRYAKGIRQDYKGTIALGGIHVTLSRKLPEWADLGMVGEGEETFLELSRCSVKNHKLYTKELLNIPGLLVRNNDNEVVFTGERPVIADLDAIPIPAREKLDMKHYLMENNVYGTVIARGLNIMSSRGCVYSCEYCASSKMWGNIRFHSAERVVDELQMLMNAYDINHFWASDDHFLLNTNRLSKIADIIEERNMKLGMGVHARIESYNEKMSALLKRIGIEELAIGYETGSDRMLKSIKCNSRLTVKEELAVSEKIIKDGYQIHGLFMLNLPNETRAELQQTINFIHALPFAKVSVSIAVPMYGTRWWDIAVEQGIVPEEPDEEYWDTYGMTTLEDNRPIFKTEVSRAELVELYKEVEKYQRSLFYFDWRNRKE